MRTAFQLNKNPLEHTSFLAFPLEGHAFTVDPHDDYRCLLCKRCRALHADPEKELEEAPAAPRRIGHHKGELAGHSKRR